MCTWEARQSGRPGENTLRYTEAGLCRRPYSIQPGSPSMREAHNQVLRRHGRRSRPEALLCVMGSPTEREARRKKNTLRYTEAGLCRRPYCIPLGSPTMREAHNPDLRRHGRRSRPEALSCEHGKPDRARGPARKYTLRYMEARLRGMPYCIQLGSPAEWDTR